jgi:hypothetical protein
LENSKDGHYHELSFSQVTRALLLKSQAAWSLLSSIVSPREEREAEKVEDGMRVKLPLGWECCPEL